MPPQHNNNKRTPNTPIYNKILTNLLPNPVHLETDTGGTYRKGTCRDKPSGFNLRGTREVRKYPFCTEVRVAKGA
jgi:hypothetical protein